jgi:hypothetical protein
MKLRPDEAIGILGRTPAVISALLDGLPDDWVTADEGEGTWSPFDIVGHLIHGEETDWMPRVRMILQNGDRESFEPFDREAMFAKNRGRLLKELLQTFSVSRERNLEELKRLSLSPDLLRRKGRHPELGVVTLDQLLAAWVVHDLDHLSQVLRVMAKCYREEVGPWRKYLSIVQ